MIKLLVLERRSSTMMLRLAHIIVHPGSRNRGIGRLITQTLVDSPQIKSCDTIYLKATDLGAPVYEKIGFETETNYLFFKAIKADQTWMMSKNIRPFTNEYKEQIAAWINRFRAKTGSFTLSNGSQVATCMCRKILLKDFIYLALVRD